MIKNPIKNIVIISSVLLVFLIPNWVHADYCEINGSITTGYTQSECQGRGGSWKTGSPPSGSCSINGGTSYNYTESECNGRGGTWNSGNTTKAETGSYIPGVSKDSSLSEYIKAIYVYAIGIVGILATVVIMIGGFIWISSMGNASRVNTAKEWIGGALTGLALAMFSYTILYVINQDLVNFQWQAPSSIETTGKEKEDNSYEESGCYIEDNKCKPAVRNNNFPGFVQGGKCNYNVTPPKCE